MNSGKSSGPLVLSLLLCSVMLQACSEDTGTSVANRDTSAACSIENQKQWVYDSMLDYYLFQDQVPSGLSLDQYADESAVINTLRVAPYDRFSYITDAAIYHAQLDAGETWGYGWITRWLGDDLRFMFIDAGSPADTAGIERGETLISIDGYTLDEYSNLSAQQRRQIFGETGTPNTVRMGVRNAEGSTREVNVTSASYAMKAVDTNIVLSNGSTNVGYLHYTEFNEPSRDELRNAIDAMVQGGVEELILDLRFNPGGRVAVAAELGSRLASALLPGREFSRLEFNARYANSAQSWDFPPVESGLELNQLYVLVSGSSCSSSEILINSLRPYMQVTLIGDTTCGKPYGTLARERCGKALNLLETSWSNANGEGDFYEGFTPDCAVADDPSLALGNPEERLLASALSLIDSGQCESVAAAANTELALRRFDDAVVPYAHEQMAEQLNEFGRTPAN